VKKGAPAGAPSSAMVIVDHRERLGFDRFWPADVIVDRTRALETADYSVCGLEGIVGVERKADDLVPSLTHHRERFWDELRRLALFPHKALICECSAEDILAHRYDSKAHPRSVYASLLAIQADFGIPVLLAGSAENAAASALWLLRRWAGKLETPQPHARASAPPGGDLAEDEEAVLVAPLDV